MTLISKLNRITLNWVIALWTASFAYFNKNSAIAYPNGDIWPLSTPAVLQMDHKKMHKFLNSVGDRADVLIIKNGIIVGTKGRPYRGADWASTLKIWLSLITTMMVIVGIYLPLIQKLIIQVYKGKDKMITWRSLMNMQSGYSNDESFNQKFAYNDPAITLFITALRRAKGEDLPEVIKSYLPELELGSD